MFIYKSLSNNHRKEIYRHVTLDIKYGNKYVYIITSHSLIFLNKMSSAHYCNHHCQLTVNNIFHPNRNDGH